MDRIGLNVSNENEIVKVNQNNQKSEYKNNNLKCKRKDSSHNSNQYKNNNDNKKSKLSMDAMLRKLNNWNGIKSVLKKYTYNLTKNILILCLMFGL